MFHFLYFTPAGPCVEEDVRVYFCTYSAIVNRIGVTLFPEFFCT